MLSNLRRAPLKPQQCMFIMKHHLVPKIGHQLVLQRVTAILQLFLATSLRREEEEGRAEAPQGYAPGLLYIYAHPADRGLGVPCLRTPIPRLRAMRMGKLAEANNDDIQALLGHPDFQFLTRNDLLCFQREHVGTKAKERQFLKNKLAQA